MNEINMEKKYKILYWADGDFAVFEVEESEYGEIDSGLGSPLMIGSLIDCEMLIALKNKNN